MRIDKIHESRYLSKNCETGVAIIAVGGNTSENFTIFTVTNKGTSGITVANVVSILLSVAYTNMLFGFGVIESAIATFKWNYFDVGFLQHLWVVAIFG